MSNSHAELAELADRVGEGAADGALSSERAVQLRAVEPLLEVLGWDVRGPEVDPAATIEGLEVEYLLTVDDVPGVLVGTADPSDDLESDEIARIERAIAGGNAMRGIATDGTTVALLVEHEGDVHRHSFPFAELPDHAEALGQFHRSVVARTAADSADLRSAARRIAERREEVVESITETIVEVADEPVEADVAAEAARTVDALVEAFRHESDGEGERERTEADDHEAVAGGGDEEPGQESTSAGPEPTPSPSDDATIRDGDAGGKSSADAAGACPATSTAPNGEYVVRFFGGSSSVGAVGTETPRGTTVGTVRYLLENHALYSSITLPWRDGEGTVVLAEEPGGDGWTTLSNAAGDAISVSPVDDPGRARSVIDGLVEAAGLRAMFQGDW